MAELHIKTESLPERCEICHQKDRFNPQTNICLRCQKINQNSTKAAKISFRGTIIGLGVILFCYMAGFITKLFISPRGWMVSLLAFVWVFILLSKSSDFYDSADIADSDLSIRKELLVKLHRYSMNSFAALVLLLFISGFYVFFISGGDCQSDSLPLFFHREHYFLINHGKREVSALRYFLAGLSFSLFFYGMGLVGIIQLISGYFEGQLNSINEAMHNRRLNSHS
jgi:hypothetical protein